MPVNLAGVIGFSPSGIGILIKTAAKNMGQLWDAALFRDQTCLKTELSSTVELFFDDATRLDRGASAFSTV
jgi:hypothetical protein